MRPTRAGRTRSAIVGLLMLTACGSPSDEPTAGPPVAALRVGLLEYRFAVSAGTVLAGQVTVTITNAGSAAHDVSFSQGDRALGTSKVLRPGERQELRFTVEGASPIRMVCTLAGHATAGMRRTLSVAPLPSSQDRPVGTDPGA